MKIVFKIIKANSGSDIYFERLKQLLKTTNIEAEIIYYHWFFQFCPFLLKIFSKNSDGDIIHSCAEYGWPFKEKNKPLVVSLLHSVFDESFKDYTSFGQKLFYLLIVRPNIKKTLKATDKIVAISYATKKSFIETYGYKNIQIIYPGINLNKYKSIKTKNVNKRFKLLFVGNLIKRKGSDLLPKIMKLLGNDYVLYYTSGLRTKPPSDFNLPNMVPLGKLSEKELIKKYNECCTLLVPSRLEGFGYQIAEAMACGKPVITTNCSALPELIIDKKGGFLCEIDNVNDFVEKIKTLFENKYLMKQMGQFNRRRILDKFNLKKMGKKYKQLYDSSINNI